MTPFGMRYCTYCRTNKAKDRFKPVLEKRTRRVVNYKCDTCIGKGAIPPAVRDEKVEQQRARNAHPTTQITLDGKKQSVIQWAQQLGVSTNTLVSRLRRGWTVHRALTEAVIKKPDGKDYFSKALFDPSALK